MTPDFAGDAAEDYARFRRDLPADQAASLAGLLGLDRDSVVIDLGCGTGQIGVPLAPHVDRVIGIDPEPAMLTGLRARHGSVIPVLGDDGLLPEVGRVCGGVGAVVIGNALHWMDEAAALARAAAVLRPGGAVAVITQGPPLWLGDAPWQRAVRVAMEVGRGPMSATCGADDAALEHRTTLLRTLGLGVSRHRWTADHRVDASWVTGHLRSAAGGRPLDQSTVAAVEAAVPAGATERVTTTVLIGVVAAA